MGVAEIYVGSLWLLRGENGSCGSLFADVYILVLFLCVLVGG